MSITLPSRAFWLLSALAAIACLALLATSAESGGAAKLKAKVASGGQSADRIFGRAGADRLRGRRGNDRLHGRRGNDRLWGDRGNDRIWGDRGNDRIWGGRGNDRIWGGAGRDRLFGGPGRDVLRGGAGADRIHGGAGPDRLFGGGGKDRILARDGRRDIIDCGGGKDVALVDRFDRTRRCERVIKAKPKSPGSGAPGSPGVPGTPAPGGTAPPLPPGIASPSYARNLALIQAASVRNDNHDASPHLATPSSQLVPRNHYGARSEYLGNPGGNPEQSFPVAQGGQFRTSCEFSHFAYDDPLVFPGKPGASHLHMFFGNTHANAMSTYESLINSGSSTCNGQELNRTGYWVPAMFDGEGNVRVPERIVVYYKGEGLAKQNAEVYPKGAAMITSVNLNQVANDAGGAQGKSTFVCSDQFSGPSAPAGETIPACNGGSGNPRAVLEMNVKFPQCWNGQDPSNPDNFRHPQNGSWYFSQCIGEFDRTLTNLEYFVNYPIDAGETTQGWFLASDVTPNGRLAPGSSAHGDWWGGWHEATNQAWIDNCVRFSSPSGAPSGCGMGYLTDGGPDNANPGSGPALKFRPQYDGPIKVPAATLFAELCKAGRALAAPEDAAMCAPMVGFSP